ncbi:MAG TPA: tetratricopeptide repeat protein [Chthoniobacteraceae bacterium]|nr:tetratricopeptide repeat protein [Chthoniobacteraceae bacterium]
MAVKTDKDLSDSARTLWLKALTAIELRNNPYAVSLINAVLKETPEFLDGRRQLRKSEIAIFKQKKTGFLSGMPSMKMAPGSSAIKKDPKAAMEWAEKVFETDPYNSQASHVLKEAAMAATMPETAAFALENLAEGNPKEIKILMELGELYYAIESYENAVETFQRVTDIDPSNLEATKRGKDAAARSTIRTGKWDVEGDYRKNLKDVDQSVSLEQQGRMVLDEEVIQKQLEELHARATQEPQNLDVAKKIAGLYEQKGDLETSLQWYAWANQLAQDVDPFIARKVSDLQLKMLDRHIAEREQWVTSYPDHELTPQYKTELETLQKQKATALVDEARKRVERNPTDLQFRYELGEQLLLAGQYSDAIPELQKARNNPNVRLRAMNLLGQCYFEKGMLDLAVKQFGDASREIPTMDALKKEVLYRLGIVYEKMGKAKESLDCMKEIYDVDYSYKDVAKRVESSYGDGPKS